MRHSLQSPEICGLNPVIQVIMNCIEKRKKLLGLIEDSTDKEFMTQMINALFLIMTQCDLMHDIILKSLSGVWDQCDQNYRDLLYKLQYLESPNKEAYLAQLDIFYQQLQECWSKGDVSKAIQEKVRNLRRDINIWLMTIVKLPKQDFESQILNRVEAMKICLNFYGEHGNEETGFVFRESGRPPLDFGKIKEWVEKNDEVGKEEFMKDWKKEDDEMDKTAEGKIPETKEEYIEANKSLDGLATNESSSGN